MIKASILPMQKIANLEVFFEEQGLNLRDVLSDYQKQNMSYIQVAEKLGVHTSVIYKRAKKYGIAFLPHSYVLGLAGKSNHLTLKIKNDESKKQAILDLLADGYNQKEINEKLGLWKTVGGLSIFARKNGIKFNGNNPGKIPKKNTLDFYQRLSFADAIKDVREKNRFACMALTTTVYYLT